MSTFDQLQPTTDDLVARAKGGDPASADLLLRRFEPLINSVVGDYSAPGMEREDIVQCARLGWWEAVSLHDAQRLAFHTFAYIIMKRRVFDAIKTANRVQSKPLNEAISHHYVGCGDGSSDMEERDVADETSWELDPARNVVACVSLQRVTAALKSCLSSFEWDVLCCMRMGLTYSETAIRLNVAPKSADNAMYRIRHFKADSVRRCFDDAGYEGIRLS
jgi:RNA polymerase sporulation-specific sigma factor